MRRALSANFMGLPLPTQASPTTVNSQHHCLSLSPLLFSPKLPAACVRTVLLDWVLSLIFNVSGKLKKKQINFLQALETVSSDKNKDRFVSFCFEIDRISLLGAERNCYQMSEIIIYKDKYEAGQRTIINNQEPSLPYKLPESSRSIMTNV